jgi:GH24 family phage-related lysozyme (muramidase)
MTKEERAVELIKSLEDFRAAEYLDSAGVLTIGYGLARNYLDGTLIKLGDTCVETQAANWLKNYLIKHIFLFVGILLKKYLFNDDIYVAISSLLYNIGVNRPGPFFYKALLANKQGNGPELLTIAFRMYNKIRVNGKLVVCEGLVNRREKEIAVFWKGDEK